jgi:hypothetical protein
MNLSRWIVALFLALAFAATALAGMNTVRETHNDGYERGAKACVALTRKTTALMKACAQSPECIVRYIAEEAMNGTLPNEDD